MNYNRLRGSIKDSYIPAVFILFSLAAISSGFLRIAFLILLFCLFIIVPVQMIIKAKQLKLFGLSLIVYFSIVVSAFLGFKKMRVFFNPPEINTNKAIGFIHYFGFPLYFDTLLFLLLLLSPIVIIMVIKFLEKNE